MYFGPRSARVARILSRKLVMPNMSFFGSMGQGPQPRRILSACCRLFSRMEERSLNKMTATRPIRKLKSEKKGILKFTVIPKREQVGIDTSVWTHVVRDVFPGLQRSVKECAGSMQEHVSVQSCNEEKMDQAGFVIPGLASGFGIAQIPYRARRPFLSGTPCMRSTDLVGKIFPMHRTSQVLHLI